MAEEFIRILKNNANYRNRLNGLPVSPGLTAGRAFIYREFSTDDIEIHQIRKMQVEQEYRRIRRAVDEVSKELDNISDGLEKYLNREFANIFRTQKMILNDPNIDHELKQDLSRELINAEGVVLRVFKRWERLFRSLDKGIIQDRADDIADVGIRLIKSMLGLNFPLLESIQPGSILVAVRLLPSDTLKLSRDRIKGVVLETGGKGSHAAILAREMGIPCVSAIPGLLNEVSNGDVLIVDGGSGTVISGPDRELLSHVQDLRQEEINSLKLHEPAAKLKNFSIYANVSTPDDANKANEMGAQGIGLLRTEHLIIASGTDRENFKNSLVACMEPFRDRIVTVRLSDLGGDKPFPGLTKKEENPFLGVRGVRLLLLKQELLKMQLDVLLDLSLNKKNRLRIMVPMITTVKDFLTVKEVMVTCSESYGCDKQPPLGAMIETPSAALLIPELSRHCDFFSIGTNDLTQFIMAADRNNEFVAGYYDYLAPSIQRIIRLIVSEAGAVPVSACGEMAGTPEGAEFLYMAGIRELSVAPPFIKSVSNKIRGLIS